MNDPLSSDSPSSCPLCHGHELVEIDRNRQRSFIRCSTCYLVHVPASYHLSPEQEKEIYDYHENDIDDEGYRNFLSRLSLPLLERLEPQSSGLDFGCGPGPALAAMLRDAGHHVAIYDLYYYKDSAALDQHYNFITSTEVVEHLSAPGQTILQLANMLHPGGYLGLMTKLIPDQFAEQKRFGDWHYTRDLTHISFFDQRSFEFLASKLGLELSILRSDVILLRKPD